MLLRVCPDTLNGTRSAIPAAGASWIGYAGTETHMIIEQVRYYIDDEEAIDRAAGLRRDIDDVRRHLGLPGGGILVADPVPEDGPTLVWQCGYESDQALAWAETAISASEEYSALRDQLSAIVARIEIELYTADED